MHESKLEINGAGERYLVVYYNKYLADFDDAINNALMKHKLQPGDCPIVCLPKWGKRKKEEKK